jgi:hypothetical protein
MIIDADIYESTVSASIIGTNVFKIFDMSPFFFRKLLKLVFTLQKKSKFWTV